MNCIKISVKFMFMRIIFFNIWHGMIWKGLKKFILEESVKTDIFCFLEVDPKLQNKLINILPDFTFVNYKGIKVGYLGGTYEGRSIFVKRPILIEDSKSIHTYRPHKFDAGGLLTVDLILDGKKLSIGCVHGKARPGTKLDTPIRIKQSEKVIEIFSAKNGPIIIGGDFNLMPDTRSVQMFEKAGYKNLIKEFNIKNTRNKVSWRKFNNIQNFADYVFVSSEVKVKSFKVPYNEVSDHLPQILEFEI